MRRLSISALVLSMAVLSMLIFTTENTYAAVVFQTPNWPAFSGSGGSVNSNVEHASPFTVTGGSYLFGTVTIPVFSNDDSANDFDVTLYSSIAGAPGTPLESVLAQAFPTPSGVKTITFSGTTQLLNGTEYWIGLAAGDPNAGLAWNRHSTGLDGSSRAYRNTPGSGAWTVAVGSGAFQVTGTSIPEPSSLAMVSLALLPLVRRRSRSNQPTHSYSLITAGR